MADPVQRIANDPFADVLPWADRQTPSQLGARAPDPRPGRPSGSSSSTSSPRLLPGLLPTLLGTRLPTPTPRHRPGRPPHLRRRLRPTRATSLIRHLTAAAPPSDELEPPASSAPASPRRQHRLGRRLPRPARHAHPRPQRRAATIGFIGRRNPTKTDDDYAGPKYLNTRTTAAFTKGQALFGSPKTRAALDAARCPYWLKDPSTPTPSPSPATAPPSASPPWAPPSPSTRSNCSAPTSAGDSPHIAIATDADPAGWKAAQTAYWNLTTADADPTHIALPDGLDPAQLLETRGPQSSQEAIQNRHPLAAAMINQLLRTAGTLDQPRPVRHIRESRTHPRRRVPETWTDSIDRLTNRLHLSPGILEHQALHPEASTATSTSPATPTPVSPNSKEQTRGRIATRQRQLMDRPPRGAGHPHSGTRQKHPAPGRDRSAPSG